MHAQHGCSRSCSFFWDQHSSKSCLLQLSDKLSTVFGHEVAPVHQCMHACTPTLQMAALPSMIYTSSKSEESFLEVLRQDIETAATGTMLPAQASLAYNMQSIVQLCRRSCGDTAAWGRD